MMKTPFCESLRVVKHGTAPAPSLPANRERVRECVVERDVVTGQVRHRAPALAAPRRRTGRRPAPGAWCPSRARSPVNCRPRSLAAGGTAARPTGSRRAPDFPAKDHGVLNVADRSGPPGGRDLGGAGGALRQRRDRGRASGDLTVIVRHVPDAGGRDHPRGDRAAGPVAARPRLRRGARSWSWPRPGWMRLTPSVTARITTSRTRRRAGTR
jgi:hypothetical protein